MNDILSHSIKTWKLNGNEHEKAENTKMKCVTSPEPCPKDCLPTGEFPSVGSKTATVSSLKPTPKNTVMSKLKLPYPPLWDPTSCLLMYTVVWRSTAPKCKCIRCFRPRPLPLGWRRFHRLKIEGGNAVNRMALQGFPSDVAWPQYIQWLKLHELIPWAQYRKKKTTDQTKVGVICGRWALIS